MSTVPPSPALRSARPPEASALTPDADHPGDTDSAVPDAGLTGPIPVAAAAPITSPDYTPPAWTQSLGRASSALVVLATLASLYALHVATAFIVPVVLAIILAYLLDPIVELLQRRHIHRAIGATLVLLSLLALALSGAYLLQGQVSSIVDRLPEIASKLSRSVGALMSGDDSVVQKVRRAATILSGTGQLPAPRGAPVVVERTADNFSNMVWAGWVSAFALMAQSVVVLFLTWFLLLAGDMFKRKFIKMAGKTLSQKKINVHMLDEINRQVQRYMIMLLVTNASLGFCIYLLLKYLSIDNAGTWALVAAVLHLVPYFGSLVVAVCLGVAGFMQSGTLAVAGAAAGGSMVIATLIGNGMTTWMTGRLARMNPVAVFVSLLLFTWLWGTWGVLLAIPLAVIAKVVADHVEGLEVMAEFLGE
ncbi:Predicted PurR-regulated permease PerM [Ralstonia sp. 25mfcol4.1]|uniref:AI-2E family transporter n=1 Tax=Ralstonia sp. 25mfcol4.1 TaxID=1761899 RepID=UPI000880FDA9|nr:AI-2E family transporter [Ralstonia sp. 25mfcol4.1]SDP38855.1 Predicted PurR-regulated permease PerM [Ralstonia sp. 25mfcol4.1]